MKTTLRGKRSFAVMAVFALLVGACTADGPSQDELDDVQGQLDDALALVGDLEAAPPATAAPASGPEDEAPPVVNPDPVDDPGFPFGIPVEEFDASGPPAYEAASGTMLAFVQTGVSYDSPATANMVTVLNAETREVLGQAEIPMPDDYATHGMRISADGRWLYLPSLSRGSNLFHIVDASTLKVAKTLDVGDRQHHVDEGSYKSSDFILVDAYSSPVLLDPNNDNEVIGEIPTETFFGHYYSGWSAPDGSFAYFTVRPHIGSQNGWVSKIDLETFEEVSTLEVGRGPIWAAFTQDGTTAWVSNGSDGTVSKIGIAQTEDEDDELLATVDLETYQTYGLAVTDDGSKLYVCMKYATDAAGERIPGASIGVVDTATNTVIKTIAVGGQPDHLFLSPDGSEIWVGENRGYAVSIISTATDEVIDILEMPGDAHTIQFFEMP